MTKPTVPDACTAWLEEAENQGQGRLLACLARDLAELPDVKVSVSQIESDRLQARFTSGRLLAELWRNDEAAALYLPADLVTDPEGLGELEERSGQTWLRFALDESVFDTDDETTGDPAPLPAGGWEEMLLFGLQAMLVEAHDRGSEEG